MQYKEQIESGRIVQHLRRPRAVTRENNSVEDLMSGEMGESAEKAEKTLNEGSGCPHT